MAYPKDLPQPRYGLRPELFLTAFPFHLVIDEDLLILQAGRSLEKLCLTQLAGKSLKDHFLLSHSHYSLSFETLVEYIDDHSTLFLHNPPQTLPLKGQWLLDKNDNLLIFVGSPIINSGQDLADNQLVLTDFALHDRGPDYAFLLKSREDALADIQRLVSQLTLEKERIETTLNTIRDSVIVICERKQLIYDINPAAAKLLRQARETLIYQPIDRLLKLAINGEYCSISSFIATQNHAEFPQGSCLVTQDGLIVVISGKITRINYWPENEQGNGSEKTAFIITLHHAELQSKDNQELIYQAFHDDLTGLKNRRYLLGQLQSSISDARDNNTSLILAFMDINQFKEVNDLCGHYIGDLLLKAVATRLRISIPLPAITCRYGGDEFVILVKENAGYDPESLMERLVSITHQPFHIEEHTLTVSLSIGISHFPHDASDEISLLQQADKKMYEMKIQQKNNS